MPSSHKHDQSYIPSDTLQNSLPLRECAVFLFLLYFATIIAHHGHAHCIIRHFPKNKILQVGLFSFIRNTGVGKSIVIPSIVYLTVLKYYRCTLPLIFQLRNVSMWVLSLGTGSAFNLTPSQTWPLHFPWIAWWR